MQPSRALPSGADFLRRADLSGFDPSFSGAVTAEPANAARLSIIGQIRASPGLLFCAGQKHEEGNAR
jgi:hypothetical protein